MATINNGLLKDAKGSLGNNYFRVQNGKQVICSKPSRYRPSMEKRPKAIRDMMKDLIAISKRLTKDSFFYDLWKIKEIKGLGPYHKFISKNHFGKKNLVFGELRLSPYDNAFNVEIDHYEITKGKLALTLKPLGNESGVNAFREPLIFSKGIVIGSGFKNSATEKLEIEYLETATVTTDLVNPLNFNYNFEDKYIWDRYKDITVLLILVTLNSEEKPVHTSVTLSCHLSLEA